ncbi:hypothetical protein ACFX5D_13305 [Flavobacterium sp. LB3P45]|uniref:Uncharacterized protein n=1 Tax=Flavobacterium fructosi TaxID=3230416 RepID=A0ABW6HPH6_9FLAO
MAKQFTKVTKTYSTKNKLQLLILNELNTVDCILFSTKSEATEYIVQLYKNALLKYKGNAAVPELKRHESRHQSMSFYVDDVISISMYNVTTDLS